MKRFVIFICMCWPFVPAMGQTSLSITTDKTTSLIFPFAILHVDRGTEALLVQPVKESPAILLVKAATKDFPETNLSVVTEDGSVYSLKVSYENKPAVWVYYLPIQQKVALSTYANGLLDNPKTTRGIKDRKWGIHSSIKGLYIKDDVIYYQLSIENNSPLNYDIELLRFYIRDKKKSKRTAVQENELKPLFQSGNSSQVKAFSQTVIVVALAKFTIPDKKFMGIQLMEKNGGRHLSMKLSNKDILKSIPLPELK